MKIETHQLHDEMFKDAEDKLRELAKLTEAIAYAKARSDDVRADLMRSMELMGLVHHGDSLTSQQQGASVDLVERKRYRIDKDVLLSLGVSEDIVDKANIGKSIKPHIRFKRFREDG